MKIKDESGMKGRLGGRKVQRKGKEEEGEKQEHEAEKGVEGRGTVERRMEKEDGDKE